MYRRRQWARTSTTPKWRRPARQKVRGILYCDVHDQKHTARLSRGISRSIQCECCAGRRVPARVLSHPVYAQLQGCCRLSPHFFCIEYCCKTEREYRNAIRNCVRTVKPGGYFIMGSVMEETWYVWVGMVLGWNCCSWCFMGFTLKCVSHQHPLTTNNQH